ncbi:MAG: DoxX family membrane protein [Terracidiphilus sp.]
MNQTSSAPRIQPPKLHLASQPAPSPLFLASQQPALALAALGLLGLGILALVYGDFALVWQPVAPWFPGRTALAYITGALEVVTALGLLFRATSRWAVRILFPGIILWQLLKVPDLLAGPSHESPWLSFGETAILLAGAATLFVRLADLAPGSPFAFLTTPRALRLARLYLGLWIIPVGLSHIIYHEAAVDLIPTWIPNRSFFAYLTGAGQIASGLGLLFNVLPRVAAYAEAAQLWIYTLLIWIPAVIYGPNADVQAVFGPAQGPRMPWTALLVTWFPAACALAVARNTPAKQRASSTP